MKISITQLISKLLIENFNDIPVGIPIISISVTKIDKEPTDILLRIDTRLYQYRYASNIVVTSKRYARGGQRDESG